MTHTEGRNDVVIAKGRFYISNRHVAALKDIDVVLSHSDDVDQDLEGLFLIAVVKEGVVADCCEGFQIRIG